MTSEYQQHALDQGYQNYKHYYYHYYHYLLGTLLLLNVIIIM